MVSRAVRPDVRNADFVCAVRPPSALSALRFMTPISKSASSSPPIHHHPSSLAYSHSQQDARHRRAPHLSRHDTDAPRPTAYRTDSRSDPNRDESAIFSTPPPASPRMLEKRSESDPGGLAAAEGDSDVRAVSVARVSSMRLIRSTGDRKSVV